jgi:hypothetical protein
MKQRPRSHRVNRLRRSGTAPVRDFGFISVGTEARTRRYRAAVSRGSGLSAQTVGARGRDHAELRPGRRCRPLGAGGRRIALQVVTGFAAIGGHDVQGSQARSRRPPGWAAPLGNSASAASSAVFSGASAKASGASGQRELSTARRPQLGHGLRARPLALDRLRRFVFPKPRAPSQRGRTRADDGGPPLPAHPTVAWTLPAPGWTPSAGTRHTAAYLRGR